MGWGLRQTHLGATSAKRLEILDLNISNTPRIGNGNKKQADRATPPDMTKEPFIFRLPDELLSLVVRFAAFGLPRWPGCTECVPDYYGKPWDIKLIKTLSLVCSRIRDIAQPLLFHFIKFHYPNQMVPPTKAVVKLHRILKWNCSLWQRCRALSVHISDLSSTITPNRYDIASDFAKWLTNVRCLEFHGGFEQPATRYTWKLIREMTTSMQNVEHLVLSREGWGLYLGSIMSDVDFPRLKTLNIHGISEWKEGLLVSDPKVRKSLETEN